VHLNLVSVAVETGGLLPLQLGSVAVQTGGSVPLQLGLFRSTNRRFGAFKSGFLSQ